MDIISSEDKYGFNLFCHVQYGFCRLTIPRVCQGVIFLSTLNVDIAHRRQGIASRLLSEAETAAKMRGFRVISLQVESNSWMKEWYERIGYIQVAEGYEDGMIIMSRFL